LWWTKESPILAFFLMPSRFWELSAGAVLLLGQRQGFKAGCGKTWLRWSGYGLLLLALLKTSAQQGFPAPGALMAVFATLLLLHVGFDVGPQRFLPWRWLERALVACGLLSYSLYLWHWPVLTFLRWTYGIDRVWLYLVAIGLAFGLAWLAYVLIEQPVRRKPLNGPWQWGLALAAIGITWSGIDALAHPFRGKAFLGSEADPVPKIEKIAEHRPVIIGTEISDASCSVANWTPYDIKSRTDFNRCSKGGRPGVGEIFLLGDSHAHHLLPMLDKVTNKTGHSISFTFKSSCLISSSLTVSFDNKPYEPCRQFAAGEIGRAVERLNSGDIVLVSTWLNKQLADIDGRGRVNNFPVYLDGRRLQPNQVRAEYIANTRAIARQLAKKNIQLVLVVDIPALAREPLVCEAWGMLLPDREGGTFCSPSAEITTQMQTTLRSTLAEVAKGLPNVHIFDPTDYLLSANRVQHRRLNGTLQYADSHHLSYSGSKGLADPFLRFLKAQGLSGGNTR
jgi:hypothetical protein